MLGVALLDLTGQTVAGEGGIRDESWGLGVADDVDFLDTVLGPLSLRGLELTEQGVVGMASSDQDE